MEAKMDWYDSTVYCHHNIFDWLFSSGQHIQATDNLNRSILILMLKTVDERYGADKLLHWNISF
jgi:hypothetical protein